MAVTTTARAHKREWHRSLRRSAHVQGRKALLCQDASDRIKTK